MPHVDDGILHAYLDGALDALDDAGELPDGMTAADAVAHLQSCPDCSSRLRIERDVRARAGLVLADAAPAQLEMPPFPAAVSAAPQARRRRAWVPVSWAASMLMALGAGWWGSEIWRSTMSNESYTVDHGARQMSQMSAEDAGAAASPGSESETPTSGVDATDPFAAPPTSPAASVDAGGVGRTLPAEAVAEAAPQAVAKPSNAPAPPVSNALADAPPPAPSIDERSAPAQQTNAVASRTTRLEDVQTAPPPVALRRESAPTVGAQLMTSSEARTIPSGMTAPLMRGAVAGLTESADMTLVAQAADRAAFQRLLADFEAVRFAATDSTYVIGRSVLVFGAATDAVVDALAADGQVVVRVRQTLATGEAVEVLSWQPAIVPGEFARVSAAVSASVDRNRLMAEPRGRDAPLPERDADSLSTLSDGRRQIVARTDTGQWIALRADLPATELRVLMSRLLTRP